VGISYNGVVRTNARAVGEFGAVSRNRQYNRGETNTLPACGAAVSGLQRGGGLYQRLALLAGIRFADPAGKKLCPSGASPASAPRVADPSDKSLHEITLERQSTNILSQFQSAQGYLSGDPLMVSYWVWLGPSGLGQDDLYGFRGPGNRRAGRILFHGQE